MWEAVWHRQFGGIWELEVDSPLPIPTLAALGPAWLTTRKKLDPHTAATKARSWLRKAARCGNCTSWRVCETSRSSDDYNWLGLYDDRGHLCYCPCCQRPFAVTVRTGFVDTDSFASKMVLRGAFQPINEAPADHLRYCPFDVIFDGRLEQKDVKDAMRVATRWADGVCEVDADGNSVHAKSGFSGASVAPAAPAAAAAAAAAARGQSLPTTGTWAIWPDAQN